MIIETPLTRLVLILALLLMSVSLPIVAATDGVPSPNTITALGWSPDSEFLAIGLLGGYVEVVKSDTQQIVAKLEHSATPVYAVAWSPDDSMLAAGSYDGVVQVWDMPNHTLRYRLTTEPEVYALSWTPDSSYLFATTPEVVTFHIWDTDTGELVNEFRAGTIVDIVWSPDNTQLALANATGSVLLLSATTYERLARFRMPEEPGRGGDVYAVAWHPESNIIASGSRNGKVRLWDIASGEMQWEGDINYNPRDNSGKTVIRSLHFSSDGQQLTAVSADGTIRTWDLERNIVVDIQAGGLITAAAWSPAGDQLAYALRPDDNAPESNDGFEPNIKILNWPLPTPET